MKFDMTKNKATGDYNLQIETDDLDDLYGVAGTVIKLIAEAENIEFIDVVEKIVKANAIIELLDSWS